MKDLPERLRYRAAFLHRNNTPVDILDLVDQALALEAADRVEQLESEVHRLRKGLEQIADSIIPDPLHQFITDLLGAEQ